MESKKRKVDELLLDESASAHAEQEPAVGQAKSDISSNNPTSTTTTQSLSGIDSSTSSSNVVPVPGSGFSAYAKINPFAMATANAKSTSFGFHITTTPKEGQSSGFRPNFTMPAPLTVPSPKSPKANPFSSPSPAHNPFMTIVESKDELWQAMAKDKLSDEEAAKTSLLEAPNKKPRTSKFGYGFGDSFGSSMQPNTSGERAKSLFETGGNGNDDDDGDDDNAGGEEDDDNNDGPQVAFTTYALPENAVVVTGEESEICLMQVRVKLFRLNYKHKESEEDGLKSMLTLGPTSGTKDSDHGRGVPLEQPPSIDTAEEDNGGSKRNQNKEKDNEKEKDNSKVGVDMSSAEWVEVGIGPLKVLQSKQLDESLKDDDSKEDSEKQSAGKKEHFRIVMRREEKKGGLGTKLLLNIRLDQYVTVVPASDKALRILGVTYNEDSTSSLGTFLIKSKTAQECTTLLNLIKSALPQQSSAQ